MLDIAKIRGISFDLDDTLWPIWPTIERAEKALLDWLGAHAPMAAALFANPGALRTYQWVTRRDAATTFFNGTADQTVPYSEATATASLTPG